MADEIEKKQQYLRNEIIDKGYNPQEFSNFIESEYGDKGLDVESWSFSDLQNIVNQFKNKHQIVNEEKVSENPENKLQEEPPENNKQNEVEEKNLNQTEGNQENVQKSEQVINQEQKVKQVQNNNESEQKQQKANVTEIKVLGEPFADYVQTIKAVKLEPNELTEQNNLKIIISNPQRVKGGIFSQAYYQYKVETKPLDFCVTRKVSDFTFLHETLPLINNIVFNPVLPHFEFGLKDDSPKKMLYIKNYMNSLIENRFFRTLPIVYEFLKMPQVQWEALRAKKYTKMKPNTLGQMPTLEGEILININKNEDDIGMKIKDEINKKTEAFNELNNVMDEILALIEKLSNQFNLLSISLNNLKKSYTNNDNMKDFFDRLNKLSVTFSKNYIKEKEVLKDGFKYFFKFMGKENTQFLKKYDEFKVARTDYLSKYEKLRKTTNKPQKEVVLLDKFKKYYGIQLNMLNREYIKFVERQANRCLNQFMLYDKDKEIILQNLNNCLKLFDINSSESIKDHNLNTPIVNKEAKLEEQNKKD